MQSTFFLCRLACAWPLLYFFLLFPSFFLIFHQPRLLLGGKCVTVLIVVTVYRICVHDCHFHPEILFRLQVCAVYRSAFFVFFLPRYMAALLLVHAGWCVPFGREAFHVRMLVRSLSLLVHTIALLSTRYTSASSLHPPLRQLPRGGSSQVLPTPHPTRTSFCLSVSLRICTDRCSRVSSSDTLRSPWLLPLREHSTWFLTRFFEFLRV